MDGSWADARKREREREREREKDKNEKEKEFHVESGSAVFGQIDGDPTCTIILSYMFLCILL